MAGVQVRIPREMKRKAAQQKIDRAIRLVNPDAGAWTLLVRRKDQATEVAIYERADPNVARKVHVGFKEVRFQSIAGLRRQALRVAMAPEREVIGPFED